MTSQSGAQTRIWVKGIVTKVQSHVRIRIATLLVSHTSTGLVTKYKLFLLSFMYTTKNKKKETKIKEPNRKDKKRNLNEFQSYWTWFNNEYLKNHLVKYIWICLLLTSLILKFFKMQWMFGSTQAYSKQASFKLNKKQVSKYVQSLWKPIRICHIKVKVTLEFYIWQI